jgi:phospholipase C
MSASDPIRHVVLLMLENRSFDQMLGDLKSINAGIEGIDPEKPGSNIDPKTKVPILQQGIADYALPDKVDIGHEPDNVDREMDLSGTPMSGFVREFRQNNSAGDDDNLAKQVMAYFPIGRNGVTDTLPALQTLAREFTVCDRWFSSLPGPTWPNRLFALTGTSAGWRSMPNGLHISGPPYFYGQDTIFNRFADQGLRARAYCDGTSMTWILRQTWLHPSWRRSLQDFFADTKGNETNFPAFAFVEPNYFGKTPDDQHPPHDVRRGEALIANVYNAIRANHGLWESTLLVVVYDEHGGFYDHVVPPGTIAPDGANQDNFPFTQLGVRVPCVLVSPWLPRGVSHTNF